MVGLTSTRLPRFVQRYAETREYLKKAVEAYVGDIVGGTYPQAEHCYEMDEGEAGKLTPARGPQ